MPTSDVANQEFWNGADSRERWHRPWVQKATKAALGFIMLSGAAGAAVGADKLYHALHPHQDPIVPAHEIEIRLQRLQKQAPDKCEQAFKFEVVQHPDTQSRQEYFLKFMDCEAQLGHVAGLPVIGEPHP